MSNVKVREIKGKGALKTEISVLKGDDEEKNSDILILFFNLSELPKTGDYLNALITSAARRHYKERARNGSANHFIKTIKTINEVLAEEASFGPAQWLGKLNAMVIGISGRDIFFSSSGGHKALLLNINSSKIANQNQSKDVNKIPLKYGEGSRPFGPVTIGEIKPGDEIIAGSEIAFSSAGVKNKNQKVNARMFAERIKNSRGLSAAHIYTESRKTKKGNYKLPALGALRFVAKILQTGKTKNVIPKKRSNPSTLSNQRGKKPTKKQRRPGKK